MSFQTISMLKSLLDNPSTQSLQMSLADCHVKGLFSLVISGKDNGSLTRVFISTEKIKPYQIQLHSHTYPIALIVIKGNVVEYKAIEANRPNDNLSRVTLPKYIYKSPLNGGCGLKYEKDVDVFLMQNNIPVCGQTTMCVDEVHTISCSKGSIWLVEEYGFEKDHSVVYGQPFITENLYNTPKQFQINDMHQLVKKVVDELYLSFKTVGA